MATGANTNQAEEQKTTETQEITITQERLDEIVRSAMGRAGKEFRVEAENLKKENEELKTKLAELETQKKETKTEGKGGEDVESLKARIEEMVKASKSYTQEVERYKSMLGEKEKAAEAAKNEAASVKKAVAMRDAASKIGFFDTQMVVNANEGFIKYDEDVKDYVVVPNDNKSPYRMNSQYAPMTLEEYFQEYAVKNPWMVRGDVKAGAGSTESQKSGLGGSKFKVEDIFGPKSNGRLANEFAKADPAGYRRLKDEARAKNLVA